jgi:Ca2+-binding EF-hand superfamily protein
MIYKGLDFSIVFAEQASVEERGKRGAKASEPVDRKKTKGESGIDLTYHYTRFTQQLVVDEFCMRVAQLNAQGVTQDQIRKLANFFSLNQKNQSIVYLNAWLHHLRRVATAFHSPSKEILPVICSKLLRNELVFRSYAESTAELKGKRDEEKIIEVADLRSVLFKFGVNYINQDIFVNEFTRNMPTHLEDLLTRMKNCVKQAYSMSANGQSTSHNENQEEVQHLRDLKKTDYFDRVQMRLKKLGNKVSLSELVGRMKQFDESSQGRIKIHHFINVLKHNYGQVFESDTLVGLQFELECLSPADNCVDYEEFVKLFLDRATNPNREDQLLLDGRQKGTTFQIQDYEDLLSKIASHVKQEGLDLMRIFKIFAKQNGVINYDHLRKIFELVGFGMSEQEFNLLTRFADESADGQISSSEFAN